MAKLKIRLSPPENEIYVDFEALRESRIWRLQKLQPKMKHSVWISCSGTYLTTELRVEKSNVCWFWTGSAMQILLTTETTAIFDTHALKSWTYPNLTTELRVEKSNVCWFWSPKSKQNLATTETTTQNETLCLNILIWHRSDYGTTGRKKKCMLILNRVCHANVTDCSLIWHTFLSNP